MSAPPQYVDTTPSCPSALLTPRGTPSRCSVCCSYLSFSLPRSHCRLPFTHPDPKMMIAKCSARTQTAGVRVASRTLPALPRHSVLARAGPEVSASGCQDVRRPLLCERSDTSPSAECLVTRGPEPSRLDAKDCPGSPEPSHEGLPRTCVAHPPACSSSCAAVAVQTQQSPEAAPAQPEAPKGPLTPGAHTGVQEVSFRGLERPTTHLQAILSSFIHDRISACSV